MVGIGSFDTFCAIGLYVCGDGTPLFLQIKEAGKSVLERLAPKFTGHQGQRVVEGQRVMQAASDIFLGWTEDIASHRYFYVRHLKNRRLGSIGELVEQEALATYAHLCGRGFALVDYPEHRNSRPRLSLPQACNAVGSIGLWFMSRLHLATSAGPVLQGLASRAR